MNRTKIQIAIFIILSSIISAAYFISLMSDTSVVSMFFIIPLVLSFVFIESSGGWSNIAYACYPKNKEFVYRICQKDADTDSWFAQQEYIVLWHFKLWSKSLYNGNVKYFNTQQECEDYINKIKKSIITERRLMKKPIIKKIISPDCQTREVLYEKNK
jgi:hypothetical protein